MYEIEEALLNATPRRHQYDQCEYFVTAYLYNNKNQQYLIEERKKNLVTIKMK